LGIDCLIDSDFDLLNWKRIGLLTNYTARTSAGELTAEVFSKAENVTLAAIFTPEHGFYANYSAGDAVANDNMFGVPVYSLYGSNRKPTRNQLEGCDAVVVDIQDIGIRSYTYISTMYKMMEACAENNVPVFVLDRPNPLGGSIVDGGTVTSGFESFIGIAPVAYVHGCTIGELAKMFNEEGWLPKTKQGLPLKCDLTVIRMHGWQRSMIWEETCLNWFPTSPNIPTVDAVRGAAMLGLFGELGAYNIGIGTALPFQYLGGVYFDCDKILKELSGISFEGIEYFPVKYSSSLNKAQAKTLNGLLFRFYKSSSFAPFSAGVELMLAIRRVNPSVFSNTSIGENNRTMFNKAAGGEELLNALVKKATDDYVRRIAQKGLAQYLKIREKYLLYE
jgi:uncharacterized protein YbbC (DUF1343 family)